MTFLMPLVKNERVKSKPQVTIMCIEITCRHYMQKSTVIYWATQAKQLGRIKLPSNQPKNHKEATHTTEQGKCSSAQLNEQQEGKVIWCRCFRKHCLEGGCRAEKVSTERARSASYTEQSIILGHRNDLHCRDNPKGSSGYPLGLQDHFIYLLIASYNFSALPTETMLLSTFS